MDHNKSVVAVTKVESGLFHETAIGGIYDLEDAFVLFLSEYFIPLLVTHNIDHSTISRLKTR